MNAAERASLPDATAAMTTPIKVYVYDLSNGIARTMSMAVVGKQVDLIPHTGVVICARPAIELETSASAVLLLLTSLVRCAA